MSLSGSLYKYVPTLFSVCRLWPQSQTLKQKFLNDKFNIPDGLKTKFLHIQTSTQSAPLNELLAKAREKEFEKNAPKTEEPWLIKKIRSGPDI